MNLLLDFSVPLLDPSSDPPSQGRTIQAKHASWTGARAVVDVFTERQSELLQCLEAGGPMSRNELAAVLKWPLSSVCSVLDAVKDRVESNGDFESVTWASGKTTSRERLRVKHGD